MRFSKQRGTGGYILCIIVLIMCGFNHEAFARVEREIQDAYADRYEKKIFFLREDLVVFEKPDDTPTFITDMFGFIYPIDNKSLRRNVIFRRGDRIRIDDIDFDAKKIEISIQSIDTGQEGEIIFDFNKRLTPTFDESRDFIRRFDEIFLHETLKKEYQLTDRISNKIHAGDIHIGMSRQEVFLTLGKPFDIVTVVKSETKQEEWIYKEESRTYRFYFEYDSLIEWVGH